MLFKPRIRNWHKISLVTLLIITLLISTLAYLFNSYWSPILAREVKEIVIKSSDSLYSVEFSSAEIHIIRGTLIINNINLKPNAAKYKQLKKLNLAPNNLVDVHVKRLILSQIHPFTFYFKQQLEIGEIILKEPVLHVTYALNQKKDTTLLDRRTTWQKISKKLKSIHVSQILLSDIKFKYEDLSGNKVSVSELKELNLSAYDLLIDSATQNDKKRFIYCKNLIAELNNYKGRTPNGLYNYEINSLQLSTINSRLNIYGLFLNPVNSNSFFNHTQADRFNLRIDTIQADNFDFLNFHKYREINCTHLAVNGGALQVYSNPNKLNNHADRTLTFPNAALKTLDTDIKIDTLNIDRFNVHYNEFNKKSGKTGDVVFNNTQGQVLNITTNKSALAKNNICNLRVKSYFMNRGKLNAVFTFNLTDNNNSFSYNGTIGPMDLRYVNPAAVPLGLVKISSGNLKQFAFDIQADRYGDRGLVKLLYNNLTVNVLQEDTILNNLKKKPLATLYANLFIVKHNNPDKAGLRPRSYFVRYDRTNETPFFKSIWQTLFTGIKPDAGYDSEKQKQVLELVKHQLENKQNRILKKELRKERREKRQQRREKRQFEKKFKLAEDKVN